MKNTSPAFRMACLILLASLLAPSSVSLSASSSNTLLFDEFNGTSLNTLVWTFNTNSSGSSYNVANGELTVYSGVTNGGGSWVIPNPIFTPTSAPMVFETRARSTSSDGLFLGLWGDGHLGQVAFVVDQAQGLLARTASCSVEYSHLPVANVDVTQYHTYRIEFTLSQAVFFVDGLQKAAIYANLPSQACPMHLRLDRPSLGQNQALIIDYVSVVGEEALPPTTLHLPFVHNRQPQPASDPVSTRPRQPPMAAVR